MNLRELFEIIYNNKITEDDVIVEHTIDYADKYDRYILNTGFDFWYSDGDSIISLNFFENDNTEKYNRTFSIISKKEFEKIIDEKEKQEKIEKLKKQLKELEN